MPLAIVASHDSDTNTYILAAKNYKEFVSSSSENMYLSLPTLCATEKKKTKNNTETEKGGYSDVYTTMKANKRWN